ncbi:unnamed protein product [Effrenium voratum]|nr:unnamed protein product [Effrenium voratum]
METPLLACAAPVSSLCASPELGLVAVGDTSGSVTLLDLSSGRVRASLATSGDPVLCVALAAPLRAALGAGGRAAKESSTVAVWDVDSGALRAEMKYKHLVTCLIFVPALHAAITGDGSFDQRSSTGRVVLWNPDTLEQHRKLQCAGAVTSLLYHQGLILSADRSRSICTWHPENGEKLQEFQVDSGQLPWCLSAANEGGIDKAGPGLWVLDKGALCLQRVQLQGELWLLLFARPCWPRTVSGLRPPGAVHRISAIGAGGGAGTPQRGAGALGLGGAAAAADGAARQRGERLGAEPGSRGAVGWREKRRSEQLALGISAL